MKARKSQAAMEFLMTYGWAILVVLIVIGALVYLGVLDPNQTLPKRCIINGNIICVASHIDTDGIVTLRLNNAIGSKIEITRLAIEGRGEINCSNTFSDVVMSNGKEENVATDECMEDTSKKLKLGQRVNAKITLSYQSKETGFSHDLNGKVSFDVEAKLTTVPSVPPTPASNNERNTTKYTAATKFAAPYTSNKTIMKAVTLAMWNDKTAHDYDLIVYKSVPQATAEYTKIESTLTNDEYLGYWNKHGTIVIVEGTGGSLAAALYASRINAPLFFTSDFPNVASMSLLDNSEVQVIGTLSSTELNAYLSSHGITKTPVNPAAAQLKVEIIR